MILWVYINGKWWDVSYSPNPGLDYVIHNARAVYQHHGIPTLIVKRRT